MNVDDVKISYDNIINQKKAQQTIWEHIYKVEVENMRWVSCEFSQKVDYLRRHRKEKGI